jgi:hypothetical protein
MFLDFFKNVVEIQLTQNYDLGKIVDAVDIFDEVTSFGQNIMNVYSYEPDVLKEFFLNTVEKARQIMKGYGELKEETLRCPTGHDMATIISSEDYVYAISFQWTGTCCCEIKKRTNLKDLLVK